MTGLAAAAKAENERTNRILRVATLAALSLLVALNGGLAVGEILQSRADADTERQLLEIAEANARVLKIVEDATSAEAQEEAASRTQMLLTVVDCNHRRVTQDVLDRLEREGILDPGQASIVGATCPPEED